MNLQCPHCQKMLTVADQYAGQAMQCPMCAGMFTAPELPQMPSLEAAPPPAPSAQPAVLTTPPAPAQEPASTVRTPTAPTPTGPYQRVLSFGMNPQVVPWIAPGALVVIFFLFFFTWVGMYAGSTAIYSQSGWQVLVGSTTSDSSIVEKASDIARGPIPRSLSVGFGWLTFLYLLTFLLAMVLALASSLMPLIREKLPPQVQQYKQWFWAITAGLALLTLCILLLQLTTGFKLENEIVSQAGSNLGGGIAESMLQRTAALRWVLFLNVLAVIGAALQFWVERRGDKPLPRIDISW